MMPVAGKKAPVVGHSFVRWGALALIQLMLLSIPLSDRLQVQHSGERVMLELVPVDPRDLLRGDYVIINLAVSRISSDLAGSEEIRSGDEVFVGLSASGSGTAKPVIIAHERQKAGPLALAGTVQAAGGDELRIDYGIDAFFLPEGEGKRIEQLPTDRVQLEVSITADGRSLPLALIVDGKPFKSDAVF